MIDELERQKPLKWDKRINSSQIEMILFEDHIRFQLQGQEVFPILKPCHNQIADKLEIPLKYYQRMETEAPELLAENVNTWLKKKERDFFIRGLGNSIRAFLSDRYRVIDHLDVLYCSLNELQAHDAEIEDCYLSEIEMNIKVKSQKLKDFVRYKDDLIVGGLFFTNSETGHKALRVEPRLFRVKCSNGMIVEEFVTREIHIGNDEFDEVIYLSIRKSIRELFRRFGEIVQTLKESTEVKISNPQKVINNLVEHYKLSEVQKDNILMAFGAGHALGESANTELALQAWRRAKATLKRLGRRIEDIIIHHDQDGVYTGHRWLNEVVVSSKARISYSEDGAKGNVHMESFIGRLKEENRLLFWEQEDLESLREVVNVRIRYYNRVRRHSALGNKSPMKYLKEKGKLTL